MSTVNTVSVSETKNTVTVSPSTNTISVTEPTNNLVTISAPFVKTGSDQVVFQSFTDGSGTAVPDSSTDTFTFTGTAPISASINSGSDSLTVAISDATTSASGTMSGADKTKLDAIESSATADQTGAQIKTAYEAESDTNAYTDAEKTKLTGIATSANNYTLPNATDSVKGGVIVNTGSGLNISSGTISLGGHSHTNAGWANAGFMSTTDKNKLDAIEASATADQTDAEIRSAVESATDSNVFTDADHTKLNGIEASATVDQTGAEIKSAYEGESDTNAFTDAEKTKLSGVATSAEVNVQADWDQASSSHDAFIQNKPTFGIANTNAVKIDSVSVADNEFAYFTASGLESLSTSETLSTIGGVSQTAYDFLNGELDDHVDDVSNPHTVTKTQIGLSNVTNVAQATVDDAVAMAIALG